MSTNLMVAFCAIFMLLGIVGECRVASFFESKEECFRTSGSPFIVIIYLISLFIIVRVF